MIKNIEIIKCLVPQFLKSPTHNLSIRFDLDQNMAPSEEVVL